MGNEVLDLALEQQKQVVVMPDLRNVPDDAQEPPAFIGAHFDPEVAQFAAPGGNRAKVHPAWRNRAAAIGYGAMRNLGRRPAAGFYQGHFAFGFARVVKV